MTRRGLLVALAVVVAVNLGVLVGVVRNRSGEPESTLLLDERELVLVRRPADDSTIRLRWAIQREAGPGETAPSFLPAWIDQHELEAIGFDCSVRPGDGGAETFYRSVLPRKAIVVVEFAGPSWREHVARWQERSRAELERLRASHALEGDEDARYERAIETAPDRVSRLLPVDVGLDPEALRAHYPDRSRYLFLQAIVRLSRDPGAGGSPPSLVGRIVEWLPMELTVPRAGRAPLSGLSPTQVKGMPGPAQPRFPDRFTVARIDHEPRYRVRVEVGRLLQPWIEEVLPGRAPHVAPQPRGD
jgi:hypothetical protein